MEALTYAALHLHTQYSMLDGASRIPQLVARAVELGIPALGLSDHGNMHGAYDFYTECTAAGIKPIIGMECYVAPAERTRRELVPWGTPDQKSDDVSRGGAYLHLTLFADGPTGLRNLYKLHREASLTGFYHKPRVDLDLLAGSPDGLICLTGCPSGPVWTRLRLGQLEAARDAAGQLKDIFGDRLYVEMMNHGLPIELDHLSELDQIATDLGLPTVATLDSHYVKKEDSGVHDALLCVQTNSKLADTDRFRFSGSGYHLLSPVEAAALDLPRSQKVSPVERTLEVAERVGDYAEVFEKKLRMPAVLVPEGWDAQGAEKDIKRWTTN